VANVQWVSGQTFGVAFFWLKEDEQQRLEQLIHHLMKSESQAG
jgi:pyruvate/oxaloacetate carboxyltransferase